MSARFGALHIYMRTLLDLLNDERGYVRIFKELDGFVAGALVSAHRWRGCRPACTRLGS